MFIPPPYRLALGRITNWLKPKPKPLVITRLLAKPGAPNHELYSEPISGVWLTLAKVWQDLAKHWHGLARLGQGPTKPLPGLAKPWPSLDKAWTGMAKLWPRLVQARH